MPKERIFDLSGRLHLVDSRLAALLKQTNAQVVSKVSKVPQHKGRTICHIKMYGGGDVLLLCYQNGDNFIVFRAAPSTPVQIFKII